MTVSTTVPTSVSVAELYPEEIFALILLTTKGSVSDLSQKILELKENNVNIGYIALRRSPEGVYSEDMDRYISFLLTFDYAQKRSPISLTSEGKTLCVDIVRKASNRSPETTAEAAKVLNLPTDILSQ